MAVVRVIAFADGAEGRLRVWHTIQREGLPLREGKVSFIPTLPVFNNADCIAALKAQRFRNDDVAMHESVSADPALWTTGGPAL